MERVKRITVRILLVFLLFFFAALVLIYFNAEGIQNHLRTNKPIESKLLILESWLTPESYDQILAIFNQGNYERILITGKAESPPISLSVNGDIILKNLVDVQTKSQIAATLEGSFAKGGYTRCNVLKNDSLIMDVECRKIQVINFQCLLSQSDSIVFNFYNDAHNKPEDRNLSLLNFSLNSNNLDLHNLNIWLSVDEHYRYANYESSAERLAIHLTEIGIPKDKITYQTCNISSLSRTYNYASTSTKWMQDHNHNSGNIVTLSYHSKRTYFSYKKANPNLNFGIISIEDAPSRLRTFKELFGNPLLRITPRFILEMNIRSKQE